MISPWFIHQASRASHATDLPLDSMKSLTSAIGQQLPSESEEISLTKRPRLENAKIVRHTRRLILHRAINRDLESLSKICAKALKAKWAYWLT